MWHCLCLDPKRNQTLPGIPKSGIWDCWAVLVQPELFSCSFQRNSLQEGNCPILGRTSSAAISQINSQIPTLFPRIPSIPSFPSSRPLSQHFWGSPKLNLGFGRCWDFPHGGRSGSIQQQIPGILPSFPIPSYLSQPSQLSFFPSFPSFSKDSLG